MKRFICLSGWMVLLIGSVSAQPMEIYCKHFFKGYPWGAPISNDLIIRDLYAMSSNDQTKFADWVAYRLDESTISGEDRSRNYKADPWLDEFETLEDDDYDGAHDSLETDRGHQAPLGSLDGPESYFETNYYSNITPQKSDLNQGAWGDLEDVERELVRKDTVDLVYVMTGPLYERVMPGLPGADEPHKVPSGYWKIIIVPENGDTFYTAAFIFDQETPRSSRVIDHLTTIDAIELRSGLRFFWKLPASQQSVFEQRTNRSWAMKYFD